MTAQQYTLPSGGGVLGDVGHPKLIGSAASEPSLHEAHVAHPGAARQAASGDALDAELMHDLCDGVVADDDLAAEAQLGGDAVGAVDAAGVAVNLGDLESPRRCAVAPAVKRAGCARRSSQTH